MNQRPEPSTKVLSHASLIQFAFHDIVDIPLGGNTAFLGPNGAGKTTILDAIQIAMAGAHGQHLRFNTQTAREGKSKRTVREYCLGASDGGVYKRPVALTYVVLSWTDGRTGRPLYSHGVCLRASAAIPGHEVVGLFVLPKLSVSANDLVSLEDGMAVPRAFNEFAEDMRRRCALAGAVAHVGTRPESYIAEHLHQLSPPGATINAADFVKVFCQTLALKQINNVNDFVRDFVVTEVKVDARRARAQIENFKRLRGLIEQVEKRIASLSVIEEHFERAATSLRRRVAAVVLGHQFRAEELDRELAAATAGREVLERTIRSGEAEVERIQRDIAAQESERERADEAARAAPGAEASQRHQDARIRADEDVKQAVHEILSEVIAPVSQVVALLSNGVAPGGQQFDPSQVHQRLQKLPSLISRGEIASVEAHVDDALTLIRRSVREIEAANERSAIEVREKKAELESLESQLRQASRGARVSEAAGYLLGRLRTELNLDAEPVASLVKVNDPSWQRAIESYLRRNREAIVVPRGSEAKAVRLLRQLPRDLPERLAPYGITIVQPAHLGQPAQPLDHQVASLISGDHPAAVAYVCRLLGTLRMVETEAELEKYDRALTKDGMLSSNGGTSRLRLIPDRELMLGRKLDDGMRDEIVQRHGEAREAFERANHYQYKIRAALEAIQRLGDLTDVENRAKKYIANARRGLEAAAGADELLKALSHGETKRLHDRVLEMKAAIGDLRKSLLSATEAKGANTKELAGINGKIKELNASLEHERRSISVAIADSDFDEELTARMRTEMERDARGIPLTVVAGNYVRKNGQDLDTHKSAAAEAFGAYRAIHRPDVAAEATWREVHGWVSDEKARLRDTSLVEHTKQADEARASAEDAFRTDLALRVRNGILSMKRAIRDLNKLLRECPAFSNGERYEFIAEPIAEHRKLLEFVENVGDKDLAAAIGDDSETHQQVMALIDDATDPNLEKARSPLEDYRQLFSFDIVISRNGQRVSKLTKRLDVGSNGENRTPLYVAAGAALAAAYRLNATVHAAGGAVVLLDEAFHGMDNQNARATANFLSSLGLQLVMAGPDADTAKVASFSDVVYDVASENMNCFLTQIKFPQAGQTVLASDMPFVHPHLVDEMIAEMSAAANAR